MDLRKYVPNGRVSTGLLAEYRGSLVWALSREAFWKEESGSKIIGVIGIGGGQEQGETLTQAVLREAMEETGATVSISPARETLWVHTDGAFERAKLENELNGEPRPVLIWEGSVFREGPDGTLFRTDYINPVYIGTFLDEPKPLSESHGLLFMDEGVLHSLLQCRRTLEWCLSQGCRYSGKPVPADALLELHGSPFYLAKFWNMLRR